MGNLVKEHGSVVYMEMFGVPTVILADPSDVERVLSSSQHITKGREYITIVPWLCEGLLTSTGSKWHSRRKMLTPTFHFRILENYIPVFNKNAKLLTEKLMQCSDSGDAVDIDSFVSLCALDVICETIMGTHLGSQLGEAREYVSAIRRAAVIIQERSINFIMFKDWIFNNTPTGREFNRIVKKLHAFTVKVIEERKVIYKHAHSDTTNFGKSKRSSCFLDCLIEMQQNDPIAMTDVDIREEVDTFMFEGHDTTSMAILWALCMLGTYPDIQEKAREEVFSVFGDDNEMDATVHDILQLQYLEMVIKESLRLYPSVPYISRWLTHDLHLRDYVIPAKTNIAIAPYIIHRNPEIYPDPEKFDPDRFLPDTVKGRHPFAYIPFSAGFRNCIGQKFALMEEKIILSSILRKLKIQTLTPRDQIKVLPQMILRPHPKILFSFTSLKS